MLSETNMARVESLRARALHYYAQYTEFFGWFYRYVLDQNDNDLMGCYAEAYLHAAKNLTPVIDEGELIVGKCKNFLTPEEQTRWNDIEGSARGMFPMVGQDSHMAVDYDLLLEKGLSGIMAEASARLAETDDPQKQEFYRRCIACMEGVCAMADNYSAHAANLAEKESDSVRRAELEKISAVCARVPKYPAESFYEAVQSVHFISFALSINPMRFNAQQFQLGHPDRYLYLYYLKDIAEGKITPEEAQLLLDCLGIQINTRVHSGLSSGYMVGGRDKNGVIVANDLTEMLMQVIDDIRLVYPAVGYCWTAEHPQKYLRTACEILSHGRSHPAIFNHDLIAAGLRHYGVSEEESHSYIHSTCVEITPVASSNVWVASPYHNLMQYLLDILNREYDSMDDLLDAYYTRLDAGIELHFNDQNSCRRMRMEKTINPLLSCLVNDCLERGLDIEQGGARYNWIMPSFVGMSNLADSLTAIRQTVFTEKKYTIARLKEMLDANYEGFEEQRLEILNKIPKYGNDDEGADQWVSLVTRHIVGECAKHTPLLTNARLIPSVFCWIMHAHLGGATGATPDGRKAGFPLGDGSGPAQGRERKGPTSSILSSTKWSHKEFIGGVAVNMKFSKRVFTAESFEKMFALIEAYMLRGGFELQINVIDRDILLNARQNPEQYQDLVVRIGGYSDYFVRLSPSMQEEILLRTEHEI